MCAYNAHRQEKENYRTSEDEKPRTKERTARA